MDIEQLRRSFSQTLALADQYAEIRYQKKMTRVIAVRKGIVEDISSRISEGAAIRCLVNGAWGFASTSDFSDHGLEKALKSATQMAASLGHHRKEKAVLARSDRMARGDFILDGYKQLLEMPVADKYLFVENAERKLRESASGIETAVCQYSEIYEDKLIQNTDGADAFVQLVRPEFRCVAFASSGSQMTRGADSLGATGAWDCLFRERPVEQLIDTAASNAISLLSAEAAEGGRKKVILSPAMVGLLSHEAIGHTVEADFVNAGSVAAGKLNSMVASSLVTMCDSGHSEYLPGAGGLIPVDDEGILTEKTTIIKDGKLVNYLHSRETAAHYGVLPTGNSRAWGFSDEPLIRMRNTYIEPGTSKLDDMIAGIEDGFYIDGPEGGQADATGEFMFGASRIRRIKNGKPGDYMQKVTVSGNAFEVLGSVDAVSEDFHWDLGAGYCGKGQPAKVDAGGPYLRCDILIGGAQS